MGKSPSVEALYASLGDSLRGYIAARISDRHIAEDLLQEAFLRIQKRIHEIRDDERIAPWVFRIVRNLIIDQYRSKARAIEREALTVPFEEYEDGESNANAEVTEWLPRFVEGLSPTYRDAVRLYELEGRSQQDVADTLGLSLSGAKSRIQRGRRELEKSLRDCCRFKVDRRGNVIDYEPKDCGENCDC